MKTKMTILLPGICISLFLIHCEEKKPDNASQNELPAQTTADFGGFESQIKWGQHLVTIAGCNDCHTPKKMSDHGPVLDSALLLSGHPAQMPAMEINRKELETKVIVANMILTEWAGPWGVSYTANLTPDETGIGNWTEAQFFKAIREGKLKGLEGTRPLLPPMPWDMYRHMTDGEISAIFSFLKSLKPVDNIVPQPLPPVNVGTTK
jgi:hypothetical protein